MKIENHRSPKGDLAIRTLAMPADTNPNGDIFGGWVISTMDLAGLVILKRYTHHRIVTASIQSMSFIAPVIVGDTVCCYGELLKIGRTSIQLKLETWARGYAEGAERFEIVTEGIFTYVAIDKNGKPTPIEKPEGYY